MGWLFVKGGEYLLSLHCHVYPYVQPLPLWNDVRKIEMD